MGIKCSNLRRDCKTNPYNKSTRRQHHANILRGFGFHVHVDLYKMFMYNVCNYYGSVWPKDKVYSYRSVL